MPWLLPVIFVLGFGVIGYLLWRMSERLAQPAIDPNLFLALQQKLDYMQGDVKTSLIETMKQQQSSSHHMTSTVRDVTERLVKIEETNRQVLSFSTQLDQLQRILSNPKQRGVLGEYYLETLLRNLFSPEQYQMQYPFKDGIIVDAAIFVKDKIVPIDSKFSLENYNRLVEATSDDEKDRLEKVFLNDIKQRILETSKYIRPQDGTTEFAFMFIPHEAIYYDLLVNKIGALAAEAENLLQRAASKYHVIIVSPTSFSAYLQTVLQGLNAMKIEEQAKEIRIRVGDLTRHLQAYESYFQSIGKHLGTAVSQYNLANKEFVKIDKDVLRITGQALGAQPVMLEKPFADE
ncbi:DNA recombination protein RmuC [Patescibacteria group bacterium]|nr:DNA recombination protein RmuC [Patescibacteria group bacterium]